MTNTSATRYTVQAVLPTTDGEFTLVTYVEDGEKLLVLVGRERIGGGWGVFCADYGTRMSSISHVAAEAWQELRVITGEKMSAVYAA